MIYRYALLQRPPMPGALPHGGLDRVESFYEKQSVCGLDRPAWGVADYTRPLTDEEIANYELAPVLNVTAPKPRPKILRNRIQCTHCGDVIESETVHDFKFCSCGAVAVDGGHDYCKRSFKFSPADYKDLSEYEFPPDPQETSTLSE